MRRKQQRQLSRFLIVLACIILLLAVWAERSLPHRPAPGPPHTEEQPTVDVTALPAQIVVPPDALVGPAQLRPLMPLQVPQSAQVVPDWVQARRTTTIQPLSGLPSTVLDPIPEGSYLKVIGGETGRLMVQFGGDGHPPRTATGWVDPVDVLPSPAPRWVFTLHGTGLRSRPEPDSPVTSWLPGRSVLEVLEERGTEVRAYSLGDGFSREPAEGWVVSDNLAPAGPLLAVDGNGPRILGRSDVDALLAGEGRWLKVPFRTQLDGSPSGGADCGPDSLAMVLEYYQTYLPTDELRAMADSLQGTSDPEGGFAIEYLAGLLPTFGLRAEGLYAGQDLRRWTLEDLRQQLAQGHPVIPQLKFRLMPGRSESDYWEDHYVVLTGVRGDEFIYNDGVDADGPGYARMMSAETLLDSWSHSYFPFAAFAIAAR